MFVLLSLIKVRDRLNLEWKSKRFFIICPQTLKYVYREKSKYTKIHLKLKTRQFRSLCRPVATPICANWAVRVRTGEW